MGERNSLHKVKEKVYDISWLKDIGYKCLVVSV